jgi:peptidyl-prolyl cis-trans isomerase B (cyclophilin B)
VLGAPARPVPRRLPARSGLVLAVALALAACGQTSPSNPLSAAPSPGATSAAATPVTSPTGSGGSGKTTTCDYVAGGTAAKAATLPPTDVPATGKVAYTLALTGGKVTVTMDRAKAPCTVNSFVSLADQGYFNGTRCHRLVDSGIFVLQCGDPSGTGSGGPGYTFADETTGKEAYTSGAVAMANAGPDTNGSQFFLVWSDSTQLPPDYTVFGQMDKASRDVVAQMAGEGEDGSNGAGDGKPNNPSEISTVTKG